MFCKDLQPIVDYLDKNHPEEEVIDLSLNQLSDICKKKLDENSFLGFNLTVFNTSKKGWTFDRIIKNSQGVMFRRKYDTYENKLIAFIDILGFSDMVNNTKNGTPNEVKSIIQLLKYIKAWESEGPNQWTSNEALLYDPIIANSQNQNLDKYDISKITNCTCISDSLIVSVPFDDTNFHYRFTSLVEKLSYIGSQLLKANIAIRGGLTCGNVIHTIDNIIMGPAYMEAYHMEENDAIYPRIILSDSVIKLLDLQTPNKYPYQNYLITYKDKKIGFDQLKFFETIRLSKSQKWQDSTMFKKELDIVKDVIECKINENRNKPQVLAKYVFLKNRFDSLNIPNTILTKIGNNILLNVMDQIG